MSHITIPIVVLFAVILLTTWLQSHTEHFDGPSPWVCRLVNGQFVAVRKNVDSDVECMSSDAKNCMWTGSMDACNSTLATKNPNPLICGKKHKAAYGATGYDSMNHWCNTLMGQIATADPEEN